MQPRRYALGMERRRRNGTGAGEYFTGYGATALAFRSGDVLAFQRMTASSAGPPFVEVWHRDPAGRWTFHVTVNPRRCVARHFTEARMDLRTDDVEVRWTDNNALAVTARRARIRLALRLTASPAAGVASALAGMIPQGVWSSPVMARATAAVAGALMGTGPLPVQGMTTAGYTFVMRPLRFWRVDGAACVIGGRDPGSLEPSLVPGPGGLRLPSAPIFMATRFAFRHTGGAVAGPTGPGSRDALLAAIIRHGRITTAADTGPDW